VHTPSRPFRRSGRATVEDTRADRANAPFDASEATIADLHSAVSEEVRRLLALQAQVDRFTAKYHG
jgi:hypothetical protein